MSQVVLGVDGGGSCTSCVIVDVQSRRELARSSSASSNWNSVGPEEALQALKTAVSGALDAAEAGDAMHLVSVCLCMSGVDTPHDISRLQRQVATWFPTQTTITVSNDAAAALASGTNGSTSGCVLIAGTGTIAFARSSEGLEARASGWGPAFQDAGSGYDLGNRALAAVARAADGRASATALTSALCQHCNITTPEELIKWAYADTGWARIAALAPHVVRCAQEQDTAAVAILHAVVPEMIASIQAVADRSNLHTPFDLVLSGGLMSEQNLLVELLTSAIMAAFPGVRVVHPEADAATGAALLAAAHLPKGS